MTESVSFTRMDEGDQADYDLLAERFVPYANESADRVLDALRAQRLERASGYQVDRCEHAVQSATRARRDGADVDWVVAALVHDIGDGLAPRNHDRFAAEVVRPYVREEVTWVVGHHGIFQQFHNGQFTGDDVHARERFRKNRYFESCAAFCERWDMVSFDPAYDSDPLESFEDDVRAVFTRRGFHLDDLRPSVVVGIP